MLKPIVVRWSWLTSGSGGPQPARVKVRTVLIFIDHLCPSVFFELLKERATLHPSRGTFWSKNGGAGFRTPDATDMSRMLYHLSYTA